MLVCRVAEVATRHTGGGARVTSDRSGGERPVGRRDGPREGARPREPGVDSGGRGASLGDGPDDERLSATGVAGHEDAGDRAHEVLVTADVAALVEVDPELLEHTAPLRSEEAHREEDELRRDLALRARLGGGAAVDELDLGQAQ